MHKMQKLCLKFLFLFSCLAISVATAACPSTPVDISNPGPVVADQSQIGMDANGNAVAIWREYNGANSFIMSATLPVNGSWSSPMLVTSILGDAFDANPQITVNATNGDAFAIWLENGLIVNTSILPFGSTTWDAPFTLSSNSVTLFSPFGGPQIAVNPSNASNYAVAIWVQNTGTNDFLQSAYYQAGVWSAAIDVVPLTTDQLRFPQVGIDNSGMAIAVWQNNTTSTIQGATLPLAGATWSLVANIGTGDPGVAYGPRLAVGSSNYAVVAWHIFNLGNLELRYSIFTGTWSTETTLAGGGGSNTSNVAVAMDQAENAMFIWRENAVIRAAYLPSSGLIQPTLTVSTAGGTTNTPDVAFDIAGNAYATWTKFNPNPFIELSTLPFGGGSWSTPSCTVSTPSSLVPHIASFPTGYAVLDWVNSTTTTIQSATLFPPPVVVSINPTSGSISGGNVVIISGTNLSNPISIEFGSGNFATDITPISSTEIAVVVPQGASLGTVDVIVTTGGGPFTLVAAYTYLSPICWQR